MFRNATFAKKLTQPNDLFQSRFISGINTIFVDWITAQYIEKCGQHYKKQKSYKEKRIFVWKTWNIIKMQNKIFSSHLILHTVGTVCSNAIFTVDFARNNANVQMVSRAFFLVWTLTQTSGVDVISARPVMIFAHAKKPTRFFSLALDFLKEKQKLNKMLSYVL